jgi:tetratricopeptide (TPR) repeat protein
MMNKLAFLLLMLLLACSPGNEDDNSTITELNASPVELVLDSLSKEIIDNPKNSNNYYRRAHYFYKEGEFEQANSDIQRALVVDSTVAEYHYFQGEVYYANQQYKEAFSSYQKAVEYDNEHEEAILKLSQIELVLQNYDLAIEMVNKALKINPMNASAYYLKGFIYLDARDTTTAISSFQTAIEVDPDHYDSYVILGKIYSVLDPDFSETYYTQAIDLQPQSIEALYNMGVLLQGQERYAESYPIYDRIIEIDSTAYFAYYNKGYVLLVSDSSYTKAIEEFESSLRFYPYYHQAYCNIGLCYENLGEYDEAVKNYKKALEINPQFEPAARGLSRILE